MQVAVGGVGLGRGLGQCRFGGAELTLGPVGLLGELGHLVGAGIQLGGDAGRFGALVLDRTGGAGSDGGAGGPNQHGEGETCPDESVRCPHECARHPHEESGEAPATLPRVVCRGQTGRGPI